MLDVINKLREVMDRTPTSITKAATLRAIGEEIYESARMWITAAGGARPADVDRASPS